MPGLNTLLTLGAKIGERVGPALSDLGSSIAKGIRAYHGSPHDFERFDLSKIGTGEGAQAYGHGLYFAENEGVARSYKRPGMHSYIVPTTIDGVPVGQWSGRNAVEQRAADALARNPTVDEAIKYLQQDAGTGAAQEWLTANAGRIKDASKTGRMYEVNINAQPEQFLNYDVPFSQQSPQVQQALRSMSFQPHRFEKGATGAEALGSDFVPKGQLSLPRYVDEGIPGIKYLDQGSRAAGQGSSNYVLFNDKIIDILRKYGLAGGAPVGGALMQQGSPDAGP